MTSKKMELDALILAWNFFSVSVLEFVSNEGSGDAVHKRMRVWVFTIHITYRVMATCRHEIWIWKFVYH